MKIDHFKEQQRELFEEFKGEEAPKKPPKIFGREKRFLLSVSFDTLLLGIVLSLMTALLLYAVGVEIGRRQKRMLPVVEKRELLPTVETKVPPAQPPQETPKPKQVQQKPNLKPIVQQPLLIGAYTIQVASYRQTGPAQKALEPLKKKGYGAFLLTDSGSAKIAVCVGNFAKAPEAQRQLKELKQMYPDCFVRKR